MTKKKNKYKKSSKQILMEYIRTAAISFCAAGLFTILLAIHARSEMIKNLYINIKEQQKIDQVIALQIVRESDLIKDLKSKKYSICLQVGNLYATAGDYKNAEFAYRIAISKAGKNSYMAHYNLINVLLEQENFKDAEDLIKSIKNISNKNLIKFKAKAYIAIGDKYYSIGKFLSAAKNYEKAKFFYDKFNKKNIEFENSIETRIINAYIQTADLMVKNGYNSDAARFLKKAEKYAPDNFEIQYKLAIVYSDLDPIKSVKYFEPLFEKEPQNIDYSVYNKALMKAANIADLENKHTLAKLYRYKIHSNDLFVNRKVVYKNDIETIINSFTIRKIWFTYKLKANYKFKNISNYDINHLNAEFVLKHGTTTKEKITKSNIVKNSPLISNGGETENIKVTFGKNIFTKKELDQYTIDILLYKDDKYKTQVFSMKIPLKSFTNWLLELQLEVFLYTQHVEN